MKLLSGFEPGNSEVSELGLRLADVAFCASSLTCMASDCGDLCIANIAYSLVHRSQTRRLKTGHDPDIIRKHLLLNTLLGKGTSLISHNMRDLVMGCTTEESGSIPGFFSSPQRTYRPTLGPTLPASYPMVTGGRGLSPGVKRSGREADSLSHFVPWFIALCLTVEKGG
jgi:hypothetical protein